MRTLLCLPQGHCGSSSRLGSYSRKSPKSFPAISTQTTKVESDLEFHAFPFSIKIYSQGQKCSDSSSICTPTQSILRSNNHGVTDMWTLSFNSTTLPKIFGIKCLGITPSYRQRAIMVERLKYRLKMEEEYQTGRNSCHTK